MDSTASTLLPVPFLHQECGIPAGALSQAGISVRDAASPCLCTTVGLHAVNSQLSRKSEKENMR